MMARVPSHNFGWSHISITVTATTAASLLCSLCFGADVSEPGEIFISTSKQNTLLVAVIETQFHFPIKRWKLISLHIHAIVVIALCVCVVHVCLCLSFYCVIPNCLPSTSHATHRRSSAPVCVCVCGRHQCVFRCDTLTELLYH